MNCTNDTTITGEYWAYAEPTAYSFEYFAFSPYSGGHNETMPSLKCDLLTKEVEYIVKKVLKEKERHPFSCLSIQRGVPHGVRFEISGYMLFDYDMIFAKNIESLIHELENKGKLLNPENLISWQPIERYQPIKKSKFITFSENRMSWVHSSPDKKSGLGKQRLRLDLHHDGNSHEQDFLKDLKSILDESQIEYLEYQEYMNNYIILVGNGRQGVNGNSVTCSSFELFREKVLVLISKYGFSFGHDKSFTDFETGLRNYEGLVQSPKHILKDQRYK